MCSVSAVSDYYRDLPLRGVGQSITFPPVQQWDPEAKQLLREVLDRLDKLDKRLGDIECHDESKEEIRRQLGL